MRKPKAMLASLLALFLVGAPQAAKADNIANFSYAQSDEVYDYGSGKKENYDVAVFLPGSFAGKTVTAISVPFNESAADGLANLKVWLSKELNLSGTDNGKKRIAPDVASKEGTVAGGYVTIQLDEPYTITADGVYAGFSFDVSTLNEATKNPILVTQDATSGSFFIHSSRTNLKWADKSEYYASTLSVLLSGVEPNAASVSVADLLHGKVGATTDVKLTITNAGSSAISSVDYSYEVGGQTGNGHLDVAIANRLMLSTKATISLPALQSKGEYPVKITLTKVNGQANTATSASAEATLNIYSFMPKHHAVLEEYTGTWCGFCPRGLVGLEVMNKRHPADFIGISYHNGDPMDISTIYEGKDAVGYTFPSTITGFPAGWLDRTYEADAYYGFDSDPMGIDDAWQEVSEVFAPAEVAVKGVFDDANTILTVTADATFVKVLDKANYKMEFVVLEDDMYDINGTGDSDWKQSNYYSGGSYGGAESYPEEEFATFYNGASYVEGYHFRDVIIATSRTLGTDKALPTSLEADKAYSVSTTFDVPSLTNVDNGGKIVQDVNKLRVVALLIDGATGAIVNANKAQVEGKNIDGISSVENTQTAGKTQVYDLSGRQISHMQKGVNIVRMANGKTVKVLRTK